ncbi:MAG: VOC family protein [Rubrivivax sp.]|nr:VOC family protein [Rubrivivax sp.]
MEKYADVYQTPGAFSWCELMTSDAGKAAEFYTALFGWTVETMNMGQGPYHVVKAGGTSVGGIMTMPPDAGPMPPMWGAYVTVADADETVAKCQSLGGKLLVGPMDIPTVGRFAVLQDPQGAVISVMAYSPGG